MAGDRHHFIPQFLQRGFSSHSVGSESFTWVYRKGTKPFNANIKNSGVKTKFYYDESSTELDNSITQAEGVFAALINGLREGGSIGNREKPILADFLAHLEARTRHIRISFAETGKEIATKAIQGFSQSLNTPESLRTYILTDPAIFEEAMAKALRDQNVPPNLIPALVRLGMSQIDDDSLQKAVDATQRFSAYILPKLTELVTTSAKKAQISALSRALAPNAKAELYKKLNYKVLSVDDVSISLGDSAIIFAVEDERRYAPFLYNADALQAVILPITSRSILIGSSNGYDINLSELPREIARCSMEYFIADERCSEWKSLARLIGDNSYLVSAQELDRIVSNSLDDRRDVK